MSDEFDLALFLDNLPHLPGVYRMLGKEGQVLYVGKAVNLYNRVRSYFSKGEHSPRISLMVRQIHSIEITVTRSEAEALILENNLIKTLSPKYNILFRDDKSYPYLQFSARDFPQISYYRGALSKPDYYFGPYPNSHIVHDTLATLQKIFRLRTCTDSVFKYRKRPCLLFQIRRCSAPCTGLISQKDYSQDVMQARQFLLGHTQEISDKLTQKMYEEADKLNFEEAGRLRDQIQSLVQAQAQPLIDDNGSDKHIDIIATVIAYGMACVHIVSIQKGRRVLDNDFFPKGAEGESTETVAQAFITQRYLGQKKPNIIISNIRLPESLQLALNQESKSKIIFITSVNGVRKVWLSMAEKNAHLALEQRRLQTDNQHERCEALAQLMGLTEICRLECFDISHTFGEATVASCVVYDHFTMQNNQYRRFNIKSTHSGDDYTAMREALTRRYTALAQGEDVPRPDVVVIDGGKGQISVAQEVWADLGLDIPLIGVAKGPERKAGEEDLILPNRNEIINLPPNHPALLLLQTVRDEAHRFAITGHRKKRQKARIRSQLDDIPGIGAKRKRALLTRFGSVRGIQAAACSEIAQTEGISMKLAELIYQTLHEE